MSKNFHSGHRKWNTLAFRGRLMSLLAPARGMSTLPAKGGFSRPSSFTHSGVSPRPHLPQDKEGFGSDTSHAEKAVFFFKESRIFHLLGQFIPRLNKIQCAGQLNGMEGGDSSGNSTSLKTPQYPKEGRLKPFFANNADIPFARARRLRPCPRQSRHCESGLLEQMSTLCCYKVKASACSGNQQFQHT